MTSSGGVSGASPSGEGRNAEWRCIYDRLEALLPRVEALAADGARLEALNKLLHEYGDARDKINQARLCEAELSRHRWEAACKELLPGDSPKLTELLECDLEDSRLCRARFEIENSELKIQLKEVRNRVELNENHADHEHPVKKLRAELSKLKQAYETLCSNKDTEVSTLLAEKDLVQNELRAMERDSAALFKIKEVEAAKATEAALQLQQNIEEMQVAAQNKDNDIGRSKAEAANAKRRALILEGY